MRAGQIVATLINLQRKKGSKPYTAHDVLPNYKPIEQHDGNALLKKAEMITAKFGGTDLRTKQED
jgi:hypothetical protein